LPRTSTNGRITQPTAKRCPLFVGNSNAFPGSGHLTPVEEELRQLRADVKRLEMERDILKKATAFFATQMK